MLEKREIQQTGITIFPPALLIPQRYKFFFNTNMTGAFEISMNSCQGFVGRKFVDVCPVNRRNKSLKLLLGGC